MKKYRIIRRYITNEERSLHNEAVFEYEHERKHVKNAEFRGLVHFHNIIHEHQTHFICMEAKNTKGDILRTPAIIIAPKELRKCVSKMTKEIDKYY